VRSNNAIDSATVCSPLRAAHGAVIRFGICFLRPRVRVGVHRLYLPDSDMRANLSRDDARVPEQPLNYP
jgi:hypothetical protein